MKADSRCWSGWFWEMSLATWWRYVCIECGWVKEIFSNQIEDSIQMSGKTFKLTFKIVENSFLLTSRRCALIWKMFP